MIFPVKKVPKKVDNIHEKLSSLCAGFARDTLGRPEALADLWIDGIHVGLMSCQHWCTFWLYDFSSCPSA